eukprot:CAMPEP_0177576908 /NCGR_PEP_ID=MMETSP0369-20130122/80367_1 /TAXON_ID=447022 ORGANISM="Scrippsiella hangoei-like, Strain SHHI-4" /NCGR_SAMPLE_ID=MMETSP0369 /ASSEMBLY_ACC=CAM_ASM_000364 /LENGTH=117 /DNA_ID=CAMNT_0019065229 /DNA_START=65 /DNA_END=416 /DNA_ORIENTATION=-
MTEGEGTAAPRGQAAASVGGSRTALARRPARPGGAVASNSGRKGVLPPHHGQVPRRQADELSRNPGAATIMMAAAGHSPVARAPDRLSSAGTAGSLSATDRAHRPPEPMLCAQRATE